MISNTLFITYTIMCFLGLQAITLIVIVIKHSGAGNKELMSATRNFVIVSLALGLFYYITYYRELVLGKFAAGMLMRGFDAIIFYALGYSWLKLMDRIIISTDPKSEKLRKHINIIFPCLMVISATIYMFLLDEFYTTDFYTGEIICIASEAVMGIVVVVYTGIYVMRGYRELMDTASRRYIMIVSVLVCFNTLWNNIVVTFVFLKAVSLSILCSNLYAVTSILLLIINLLTVQYVYKKDFSSVFFGNGNVDQKQLTEEESLNMVAENHRLTERERDVMFLAYEGLTNPDIAEKLYISRHTVKRHIHNIFEKLDVSTRMELVHMVHTQMKDQTVSK